MMKFIPKIRRIRRAQLLGRRRRPVPVNNLICTPSPLHTFSRVPQLLVTTNNEMEGSEVSSRVSPQLLHVPDDDRRATTTILTSGRTCRSAETQLITYP